MAQALTRPIRGFGVFDPRFSFDNLSANGSGSTYTQAGPRPGTPVSNNARSRFLATISARQDTTVYIKAGSAGMPGAGLRTLYKVGSDSDDDYRGWTPPHTAYDYVFAAHDGAATYEQPSGCVIPSSQKVVVIYDNKTQVFDPETVEWDSAVSVTGFTSSFKALSVCVTAAEERLLAFGIDSSDQGQLAYSDDGAATWSQGATDVLLTALPATSTAIASRMFEVDDDLALFIITDESGTTHVHQFASSTGGGTFREVNDWSAPGGEPEFFPLRSGRLMCLRIDGSSFLQSRTVGSPWDSFEDATDVEIDGSTAVAEFTGVADFNGDVWVYGRTNTDELHVWRSQDEGASWEKMEFGAWHSGDATHPTNLHAVAFAGGVGILTQFSGTPSGADNSIGMLLLGGFHNWGFARDSGSSKGDIDLERINFGPTSLSGRTAITWAPFDRPDDIAGFTQGGTGVIGSEGAGYYENDQTSATWYFDWAAGTDPVIGARAVFKVVSGGDQTQSSTGFLVRAADGAAEYEVEIRADTAGITAYDTHGTADLGSAAITGWIEVVVLLRGSTFSSVDAEIRAREVGTTKWTKVYNGAVTDGGAGAANGSVRWQRLGAVTGVTQWRFFAAGDGYTGNRLWHQEPDGATPYGLPLSSLPYPLGDFAADGAMWHRAVDGPGFIDDVVTIEPAYEKGIENLFPLVSPSPADVWESTDEAEVLLEWDLDQGTYLDSVGIGLVALNHNILLASLEGWNGSTWATMGDGYLFQAGGVDVVLNGDIIEYDGSGTSYPRYIQDGELVGGHVYFTSSTSKIRRIVECSGGVLGDHSGRQAYLRIEGVDGTEPSSDTIYLMPPNVAVGFWWESSTWAKLSKMRLKIWSRSSDLGKFSAGLLAPFAIKPVGRQWDGGFTWSKAPNYEDRTTQRGTPRKRRRGPPIDTWTMSWNDRLMLHHLRGDDPRPDWLELDGEGPLGGGVAVPANRDDALFALRGIMDRVRSGVDPMLVIPNLELNKAGDQTGGKNRIYTQYLTPTSFHYCTLDSAITWQNERGRELVDEQGRINTLTFRGIP